MLQWHHTSLMYLMCYVDIKDIIYIYIKHIGLSPKIYTGSSQWVLVCPTIFMDTVVNGDHIAAALL